MQNYILCVFYEQYNHKTNENISMFKSWIINMPTYVPTIQYCSDQLVILLTALLIVCVLFGLITSWFDTASYLKPPGIRPLEINL